MGDHRSASGDSFRHWQGTKDINLATVPEDRVVGRAFALFWPPGRARWLSVPQPFEGVPNR